MADTAGGIGGGFAAVLGTGPRCDWQPVKNMKNSNDKILVMERVALYEECHCSYKLKQVLRHLN